MTIPAVTIPAVTSLSRSTHSPRATLRAATNALLGIASWLTVASCQAELTVGVSVSDLGNPYFVQIAEGAEAEARRLAGDDVRFILKSSAYDLPRQVRQMEGFIARNVDLILLIAANYNGIEPAIQQAQAAGIPVLAVDVKARGADITVTTNNRQAGEIACGFLAAALGQKGNIAIVNGPPVSSIEARVDGCLSQLEQYPDITVLDSNNNAGASRLGGLEVMTHLLAEFPHIDGVFAINDPSAVGAEQAAQMAGRPLLITSIDGAPLAIERMRHDDSLIIGSAAQLPEQMARMAIRMGYELLQGKTPEKSEVQIPSYVIHRGNLPE